MASFKYTSDYFTEKYLNLAVVARIASIGSSKSTIFESFSVRQFRVSDLNNDIFAYYLNKISYFIKTETATLSTR